MDDDLTALRARRLAEMKAGSAGGAGGGVKLPPGFRPQASGDDEAKRCDATRCPIAGALIDRSIDSIACFRGT